MKVYRLTDVYAVNISNISNGAGPPETVTCDDNHHFENGDSIIISGVNGTLTGPVNATHVISNVTATTFTIPITTGGSYTADTDLATSTTKKTHFAGSLGTAGTDVVDKIFLTSDASREGQGSQQDFCRLVVESDVDPVGVGTEIDFILLGRIDSEGGWVQLVQLTETDTFTSSQGSKFVALGAQVVLYPQMRLIYTPTLGSNVKAQGSVMYGYA